MRQFLLVALVMNLSAFARASDNSVEVTLEEWYTFYGPQVTAAAAERGKTEAEADIKAGHFHFCDCAQAIGTRKIDSATGYPVERVALCDHRTNSNAFDAEIAAYNQTMRQHASHRHR